MLSIKKITHSGIAANYFSKDDYYAKDSPEALKESRWFGYGAEKLGLSGVVESQDFTPILEGRLPQGDVLGRVTKAGKQHVSGWDFTFSAPKSVSILYELGGDNQVREAHDNAVNRILKHMQKELMVTRSYSPGGAVYEQTNNLTAALFTHHSSRDLDPQLHTHAVIMNATQRDNGDWRSLETKPLFQAKMVLGAYYRAELAQSLKTLGYDITLTHNDGRFEITGVPKELINTFSSRRLAIEKGLESSIVKDAKAAERVALNTRKHKSNQEHSELKHDWLDKSAPIFDVKTFVEHTKQRHSQDKKREDKEENQKNIALDAVNYAAKKLAEREAVFTKDQLFVEALVHSMGDINYQSIQSAITLLTKLNNSSQLISVEKDNQRLFTTHEALFLEKASIAIMKAGQGQVNPIFERKSIENNLAKIDFRPGQGEAAVNILSTSDRISGVQGFAGTGKTFMLNHVREKAENQKMDVIGLAPTNVAVNELKDSAGIKSQTLARFLLQNKPILESKNESKNERKYIKSSENKNDINNRSSDKNGTNNNNRENINDKNGKNNNNKTDFSNQLWVVDEASMISNRDMYELLKLSEITQSRVVLVGDKKQLPAVEAGKPFANLQNHGMQMSEMKSIVRQQVESLLGAVYLSIEGKIQQAIEKISPNITELPDREQRLQAVAKTYLDMSKEQRDSTLVLSPANEDRVIINELIRNGLKGQGELNGENKTTHILTKIGMTNIEKTRATNYHQDMVIRFNKAYQSLDVKKDDYFRVVETDKYNNIVTLENKNGKSIRWNPKILGAGKRNSVGVYQYDKRELLAGDHIRWTENDKERGVYNGDSATVVFIKGNIMAYQNQKGETHQLNLSDQKNRHWDYAYTRTLYGAQGKTAEHVVMHGEDFRKNLTNQKSFYVGISRVKNDLKIFVNDKSKYITAVQARMGEKTSALEALNEKNQKELTTPSYSDVEKMKESQNNSHLIPDFVDYSKNEAQNSKIKEKQRETKTNMKEKELVR